MLGNDAACLNWANIIILLFCARTWYFICIEYCHNMHRPNAGDTASPKVQPQETKKNKKNGTKYILCDGAQPTVKKLEDIKLAGNKACFQCNFCEQTGNKVNAQKHQQICEYRPVKFTYMFFCADCKIAFDFYRAYFQHRASLTPCSTQTNKFFLVCRAENCQAILADKGSYTRHYNKNQHGVTTKYSGEPKYEICKYYDGVIK